MRIMNGARIKFEDRYCLRRRDLLAVDFNDKLKTNVVSDAKDIAQYQLVFHLIDSILMYLQLCR